LYVVPFTDAFGQEVINEIVKTTMNASLINTRFCSLSGELARTQNCMGLVKASVFAVVAPTTRRLGINCSVYD
jgi:hypothetical protein